MGERFYTRFPSITEACRAIGIDPAHDRIPVAPAAHYACGGVPARLDGTTAIAGLYAVGEVSCTGVHGANRLASNSLTESVVAGTRLGRDLAWEVLDRVEPDEDSAPGAVVDPLLRPEMRAAMSRHVGVVRDVASLATAAGVLDAVAGKIDAATPTSRVAWEATNLLTVGSAVVAAAAAREESRGCHRRSDFPEPRAEWLRHLDVRLGADGELVVEDA
jgi:aspartate oxidase